MNYSEFTENVETKVSCDLIRSIKKTQHSTGDNFTVNLSTSGVVAAFKGLQLTSKRLESDLTQCKTICERYRCKSREITNRFHLFQSELSQITSEAISNNLKSSEQITCDNRESIEAIKILEVQNSSLENLVSAIKLNTVELSTSMHEWRIRVLNEEKRLETLISKYKTVAKQLVDVEQQLKQSKTMKSANSNDSLLPLRKQLMAANITLLRYRADQANLHTQILAKERRARDLIGINTVILEAITNRHNTESIVDAARVNSVRQDTFMKPQPSLKETYQQSCKKSITTLLGKNHHVHKMAIKKKHHTRLIQNLVPISTISIESEPLSKLITESSLVCPHHSKHTMTVNTENNIEIYSPSMLPSQIYVSAPIIRHAELKSEQITQCSLDSKRTDAEVEAPVVIPEFTTMRIPPPHDAPSCPHFTHSDSSALRRFASSNLSTDYTIKSPLLDSSGSNIHDTTTVETILPWVFLPCSPPEASEFNLIATQSMRSISNLRRYTPSRRKNLINCDFDGDA